jgi:hypothetical protein
MRKLGSIITSVLPVATMLICQRACICVGVCVWVLQCEETCLHALRFVAALRLSPVSLALLLQGFPRKFLDGVLPAPFAARRTSQQPGHVLGDDTASFSVQTGFGKSYLCLLDVSPATLRTVRSPSITLERPRDRGR